MAKKHVRIVALLGSASSGKSLTAQYLVKHHGFTRVRFASPLKDMLITLGLTPEQVDGPQEVRNQPSELLCGKTPRYAMQTLGTEWRDYIGKRLWARITRARIHAMSLGKEELKIVIDDMRFPHEPQELTGPGWSLTILAIRRPEVEPTKRELIVARIPMPKIVRRGLHLLFGLRPFHKSETEWFKIKRHADIPNQGTVEELYSRVEKATRIARS